MEFRGCKNRFQGVRKGSGKDEVKVVDLDSIWRKKEKTYQLEEAVGSHDHSTDFVTFIDLPLRSAPGLWNLVA